MSAERPRGIEMPRGRSGAAVPQTSTGRIKAGAGQQKGVGDTAPLLVLEGDLYMPPRKARHSMSDLSLMASN